MSKIAVVYWSGTGNTEAMANAVAKGVKDAGAEVDLFEVASFSADKLDDYSAIAFGCPSMGGEELESDEFEPVFEECKSKLGSKPVALFGSYGWGDGEWMRSWVSDCTSNNIKLVSEGLIVNESPADSDLADCENLGKSLVAAIA